MIHLIAALDRNRGIGIDNHLLCHISADLKRFKQLTMGHAMIMGRKTFESLPGLLPGREHIVVTHDREYGVGRPAITVCHSVDEVSRYLQAEQDYFVIGGASMYEAFLPLAASMYLTEIGETFTADTYFPSVDRGEWYAAELQDVPADSHNKYAYRFVRYMRR